VRASCGNCGDGYLQPVPPSRLQGIPITWAGEEYECPECKWSCDGWVYSLLLDRDKLRAEVERLRAQAD